jgi:tetratricopeptide (TPR) repeat protein
MRIFAVAVCLMMLFAPLDALAQEHDHHGQSSKESGNESGNKSGNAMDQQHDHQRAMTETLGTVSFSTSCSPAVQPDFNRAVALMHSFQFGPAISGFRGVLGRDPDCTVAYWGIALSSWSNPFAGFKSPAQLAQGLQAVEAGRTKAPKTARERAYIEAVAHLYVDSARIPQPARVNAYEAAMAQVSADYPDDIEARIFDALALAAAADPADKTYAKQLKAGATLEALFIKYPDHPGLAHYIIHAYDEPELASRAAAAARRYGGIAPSTPHALHMPSHTFTRIGDWQASIDTNMASAQAARAAGQPADELHASDYMVFAYLQSAQDDAAKKLVLASAETFKRFDPANASGAAPASAAFFANAAIPARYCLEQRNWTAAMALTPQKSPFPYADAITIFTRGLGAAHLKNAAIAQKSIADLADIRDRLTAMHDSYWANQADIQRLEVAAQLAAAQGDTPQAIALFTQAANMEDVTELASITPGPLVPAREMLGELLLDVAQPAQALLQFQATLAKHPKLFWSLYGAAQAAQRSGDAKTAQAYFQQLLKIAPHADAPRRPALMAASRAVGGER